jgi:hypothetical protein
LTACEVLLDDTRHLDAHQSAEVVSIHEDMNETVDSSSKVSITSARAQLADQKPRPNQQDVVIAM